MSDNICTVAQETFLRFCGKLNELFQMDRANMDQYYIKTSKYLRNHRFFVDPEKTLRITFKLVEGDAERDNIRGKSRVFISCSFIPFPGAAGLTTAVRGY
jgi:hypothetical protein